LGVSLSVVVALATTFGSFGNVLQYIDLQIGYGAPYNQDCTILDNLIVNGTLSINRYNKVVKDNNSILSLPKAPLRRTVARWFLNKYDPKRAYLAVFNWNNQETVDIEAKPFLKKGDVFRLLDPKAIYGEARHQETCKANRIIIPVKGTFAIFVVLKDPSL